MNEAAAGGRLSDNFGAAMTEAEAAWYPAPFAHIAAAVKPLRLEQVKDPKTGALVFTQRREAHRG